MAVISRAFIRRGLLVVVGAFWLVMNVLLWRSEYGGDSNLSASLPPVVVWEKILSAPDRSALDLFHRGEKVGYFRWVPIAGDESAEPEVPGEETGPEGLVEQLSSYRLELDGNILLPESRQRVRCSLEGEFGKDLRWRSLDLQIIHRPFVLALELDAGEEQLTVKIGNGEQDVEHEISLSDLRRPEAWAGGGWPIPPALAALPPMPAGAGMFGQVDLSARLGWLAIGRTKIRVYRLELSLANRYRAVALISRVGEILRVELPNQWWMVNDAFVGL